MPSTRLRVKEGALGTLPYLLSSQENSNYDYSRDFPYSDENSDSDSDAATEAVTKPVEQRRIPSLCVYALQSLCSAFGASQLSGDEDAFTLPDLGDFPRIQLPFPAQDVLQHLFPRKTVVNTSPLQWALLHRLYIDLPTEVRTFYAPLSDPYVLPLQRWSSSCSIPSALEPDLNLRILTTVSLGKLGSDKAIPAISKLSALVGLDLSCSSVTTAGIMILARSCVATESNLSGPRKLAVLLLAKTQVTARIDDPNVLGKFKCLQYIDLRGAQCNLGEMTTLLDEFTNDIPQEIASLDLLTAPNLFRALEIINLRSLSPPSDTTPTCGPAPAPSPNKYPIILDIDRIDYPQPPTYATKKRPKHPHEIFSEGYFLAVSPTGEMKMGHADTLVATQQRPADHEKPLPKHLYETAMGMEVSGPSSSGREQLQPKEASSHDSSAFARTQQRPLDRRNRFSQMCGLPGTRLSGNKDDEDCKPASERSFSPRRDRGTPSRLANSFYRPLEDHVPPPDGRRVGIHRIRRTVKRAGMSDLVHPEADQLKRIFFRLHPPGLRMPDVTLVDSDKPDSTARNQSAGTSNGPSERKRARVIFPSRGSDNIAASLAEKYQKPEQSQMQPKNENDLPHNPFRISKK